MSDEHGHVARMSRRTVAEALRWASVSLCTRQGRERLATHEEEEMAIARGEAETLLLWATAWSRTELLVSLSHPLNADAAARFERAVHQRTTGDPLQHITGEAFFAGRWFRVGPECLIPRPETEILANAAIQWIHRHQPSAAVLDLGTGSGILAITIALDCSATSVQAVDISDAALDMAKENAKRLGAAVQFTLADGIDHMNALSTLLSDRIHVLVSNPPYIPSADVDELDAEVRDHEPRLALDGGLDGLDVYRRLANLGPGAFTDGPTAFFLEVGEGQAVRVRPLFEEHPQALWQDWSLGILDDLRGIPRVVWGERLV